VDVEPAAPVPPAPPVVPMAITAPSPPVPSDPGAEPPSDRDRRRPLGRPRTLPGGRAVVGGLLVTLAAIGTFVAATSAGSAPTATVVVATRSIAAGDRIGASDLRAVPADLPDDVLATLFATPADVEGAVALAPLAPDQAIARTAVRTGPAGDVAATHDLAFALERDRALNGRIQPGELVDLVATFGSGAEATTEVVARGVRVVSVDAPSASGVGSSAKIVITVAFGTETDVLRAANALEVAKVTLSRSTGTADRGSAEPASEPDQPASGGGAPVGTAPPVSRDTPVSSTTRDGGEPAP